MSLVFHNISQRAQEMPPKKKYRKKFGHKRQYKDIIKVIDVNDVLEELKEENNRLLNELLFANKCLTILCEFKIFVDLISIKFKENLKSNETKKFRQLSEKVDQTIRTTNIDIKTIKSEINEEFGEQEVRDINGKSLRKKRLHNLDIVEQQSEDHNSDDIEPNVSEMYNVFNDETEDDSNDVALNKTIVKKKVKKIEDRDKDFDPRDTSQHLLGESEESDGSEELEESKKNGKIKCPYHRCNKLFPNESLLKKHSENCHTDKLDFSCEEPDCNYRTYTKTQLDNHFLIKHSNKRPFICPVNGCGKAFVTDKGLETHVKKHSYYKHKCEECHKEFRRRLNLRIHIKNCHTNVMPKQIVRNGKRRFKCNFDGCDKVFISEVVFIRHRQVYHLNPTRFTCSHPGCDFEASANSAVVRHMWSHSTERLFKCDFFGCDRDFKTPKALAEHKSRHTNESPKFKCHFEGCQRVYWNNDSFKIHLANVHLKKQEYRCEWPGCEFKTYHNASLRKHMKQSHSECIYPCDHPGCGKKFKTSSTVVKHKKQVHDKVKNQACSWPGCHYMSFSINHLKRHQLSHTKEKPFACEWPGCGFSSSQKGNVKVHMITVHHKMCPDK